MPLREPLVAVDPREVVAPAGQGWIRSDQITFQVILACSHLTVAIPYLALSSRYSLGVDSIVVPLASSAAFAVRLFFSFAGGHGGLGGEAFLCLCGRHAEARSSACARGRRCDAARMRRIPQAQPVTVVLHLAPVSPRPGTPLRIRYPNMPMAVRGTRRARKHGAPLVGI